MIVLMTGSVSLLRQHLWSLDLIVSPDYDIDGLGAAKKQQQYTSALLQFIKDILEVFTGKKKEMKQNERKRH